MSREKLENKITRGEIKSMTDLVDWFGGVDLFVKALNISCQEYTDRRGCYDAFDKLFIKRNVKFYGFTIEEIDSFLEGYEYSLK